MTELNKGDLVVLISGSMRMAVEATDGDKVSVVWCNEGVIGRDAFDPALLKKWEFREEGRSGGTGGARPYRGDREGGGKPWEGRGRGGDRDDRGGDRGGDRGDRGGDDRPRGKPPGKTGWDGKPREKKHFRKDD